jgi:hypothetical protein
MIIAVPEIYVLACSKASLYDICQLLTQFLNETFYTFENQGKCIIISEEDSYATSRCDC